jgi:hypothetical protein
MAETEEERTRNLRKIEAERARKEKLEEKRERERIKAELARDKELRKLNGGVLPSVLGVEGYNPSAISSTKADAKRTREDEPVSAVASTAGATIATPAPVSAPDANPVKKAVTTSNSVPTSAPSSAQPAMSSEAREEIIDSSIATIGRYRTGGDGGQAFNLILLFLKNIRDNPTEQKSFPLLLSSLTPAPPSLCPAVGSRRSTWRARPTKLS